MVPVTTHSGKHAATFPPKGGAFRPQSAFTSGKPHAAAGSRKRNAIREIKRCSHLLKPVSAFIASTTSGLPSHAWTASDGMVICVLLLSIFIYDRYQSKTWCGRTGLRSIPRRLQDRKKT